MLRNSSTIKISALFLLLLSLFAIPSVGFVTKAHACYDWYVGARVALRGGSEIRHGSGLGYGVHTIVPEDNWQVDVIDGPRNMDGKTWWDISRKKLDGGGTGWVYIEQAGYDVCNNIQAPAPAPVPSYQSPSGFSYCTNEGGYCSFNGKADVAYGVNGIFYYIYNVSGGISCSNDVFGDPVNGIGKACHYKITSQQSPEETQPNKGGNTIEQPNFPNNSNPPSSESNSPSYNPQADACSGYVKDLIPGFSSPPSGDYIYVPTNVERLRLRSKPNTVSCAYGWLVSGNYYQLIEEKGNWIKIQTILRKGWVSAEFIEINIVSQSQTSPSENQKLPSQETEPPVITPPIVTEVWCNAKIEETYRWWLPGDDFLDIIVMINTPNVDAQSDVLFKHNGVNANVHFRFEGNNRWKISIGFWGNVDEWEFLYRKFGQC